MCVHACVCCISGSYNKEICKKFICDMVAELNQDLQVWKVIQQAVRLAIQKISYNLCLKT